MDGIRRILRPYMWCCLLLCVLSVASYSNAATRKHVTMPTAQSVATSSGSGVPVKSGSTLSIPGAAQGEYIPFQPGDRKVPLKVIPTIDYSIPRTINAAKGILKNNAASILIGGTIAGLIAGLDWVMGEGGQIQKPDGPPTVLGFASNTSSSFTGSCNGIDGYSQGFHSSGPGNYQYIISDPAYTANGFVYVNNCGPGYRVSQRPHEPIVETPASLEPVTEQDFDMVDAYANAQNSEWLRDLLRESCAGSTAPMRCFEDLKDNVSLSGPATVAGPSTSSSGTYTKPDGTVGVRTSNTTNNYKITYGPTYFDFSKTETTVWNEDGQQVGEETVTENDDIEAEEPAEEPKEEEVASPCEGSNCDGPAYEDLYSPTEDTKEDYLDDYASRVSNLPILVAVGNLFTVSVSGSCPVWEYHHALPILGTTWQIDLVFNFFCLPWFIALGPWIQVIISLVATYGAIRIALL